MSKRDGLTAFRAGDFAVAIAHLEKAASSAPGDFAVLRALVASNVRTGELGRAAEWLAAAKACDTADHEWLTRLEGRVVTQRLRAAVRARDTKTVRTLLTGTDRAVLNEQPHLLLMRLAIVGNPRLAERCRSAGVEASVRAMVELGRLGSLGALDVGAAWGGLDAEDAGVAMTFASLVVTMNAGDDAVVSRALDMVHRLAVDAGDVTTLHRLFNSLRRTDTDRAVAVLGSVRALLLRHAAGEFADRSAAAVIAALAMCDLRLARDALRHVLPDHPSRPGLADRIEATGREIAELAPLLEAAIERFWTTVACAPDPVAAARASVRTGGVAVLFRSANPGVVGLNDDPAIATRGLRIAIGLLAGANVAFSFHYWPWAPAIFPPEPGSARVFMDHTRATDGDTDLVTTKGTHLPGLVTVDRCGFSGWSSAARLSRAEIEALAADLDVDAVFAAVRARYVETGDTKQEQPEAAKVPAPGYVLLPTQMPGDSVQLLARISQPQLARAVIAWSARTGSRVVVKRHPKCVDAEMARILAGPLPPSVRLFDAPIHPLIAGARAVVVGNSGVGFESLLHLKPVVTAAASDYEAATVPVRDEAGLWAALDRIGKGVDEAWLKTFVAVYVSRLSVDGRDEAALRAAIGGAFRAAGWIA